MDDLHERFELTRPPHISDDHWSCVTQELDRLRRSIEADDQAQALGYLKCLVESIARIVLDVNGTPTSPSSAFPATVNQAHSLLAGQPGHELANDSAFGNLATQAKKMAISLADIRNQYGGGHGRSKPPKPVDEMLYLAFDGGFLWARWALRRVGYFAIGRPELLINTLVGDGWRPFHSGELKEHLVAANLPKQKVQHQRTIGKAVGQRVMQGTIVVKVDGLYPCVESDDLQTWPRDYRVGLAYGLWFDTSDRVTLTPDSLRWALTTLEPVLDCSEELTEWSERILLSTTRGEFSNDTTEQEEAAEFVRKYSKGRPPGDQPALANLASHIDIPF